MRRNWVIWAMAAAILLVLAWAWIDGGREPLRDISEPVAMPENRG